MRNAELSSIAEAAIAIEYEFQDDAAYVRIRGNGDMDAAPILGKNVSVLHGYAVGRKTKTMCFDLTQLYFLNSSCLKAFASLITLNHQLSSEERYKIVFCIGLPWQRRTFEALRILGKGLVVLEDSTSSSQVFPIRSSRPPER